MSRGGPAAVDVSVQARDFVVLVNETKEFDKRLGTALRRNLRRAGGIGAKAAQDEVQTGWPKGRNVGLRGEIARGIRVQIASSYTGKRAGVFIVGSSDGLPQSKKPMARKINRDAFKHPVFTRDKWVTQPGHPYFDVAIKKTQPQVQALVEQAMSEALTAITGA